MTLSIHQPFTCCGFISGKWRKHLWHQRTQEIELKAFDYWRSSQSISVFTADYPENKTHPIIFGSCHAWLWATHCISDFVFLFPTTPTSKTTQPMVQKTTPNSLDALSYERRGRISPAYLAGGQLSSTKLLPCFSGDYLLPLSLPQPKALQPWQYQQGDAKSRSLWSV